MGATKAMPDIIACTDYADNSTYLRLHLDIPVSKEHLTKFVSLMESGKRREAASFIVEVDPEAKEYIDLFMKNYHNT